MHERERERERERETQIYALMGECDRQYANMHASYPLLCVWCALYVNFVPMLCEILFHFSAQLHLILTVCLLTMEFRDRAFWFKVDECSSLGINKDTTFDESSFNYSPD
jgi:hypothetical protein